MQQQVQVPTIEQLEQQLQALVLQKAQAKETVEQIDRVLPVINGQLQLLQAQAQSAKAEVVAD